MFVGLSALTFDFNNWIADLVDSDQVSDLVIEAHSISLRFWVYFSIMFWFVILLLSEFPPVLEYLDEYEEKVQYA